ncbi:hypothetical protein JNJ66_02305 [Candidatus Saccharibacteria bacterium]|nr:hypothetical protein [Candidatus Saccharibacteria bacterium]
MAQHRHHSRYTWPVAAAVAVVASIGLLRLVISMAATIVASSEPETAVITGGANKVEGVLDASGTAILQFGTLSAPSGPTLYVATNGEDGNDGTTESTPKKTIAAALSAANPGDTILVGPGTYDGNFITTKGGTAEGIITIRSATRHGAKINGNNSTSSQSAVEINHEYIRFQDFEVTGEMGTRHGVYAAANNIEIVGNHIHTICRFKTDGTGWKGGAGIQSGQPQLSGVLIDGNIIHDIGAPGSTEQLVHGMYIDAHVTDTVVSNNIIYNVEDFGLHPYDETEASGWVFVNNVIYNTGRGILQAPGGVTRNNIVFDTRGARYDIRGDGNVVSNNMGGGTGEGGQEGVTDADPLFVDAQNHDFRLQPGSPAIGAGTMTDAPPKDAGGVTRPQGGAIDMGAYEQ